MEKYKSDFIREEDMSVSTDKRNIDEDTIMRIVEIRHIPSGMIVSSEDRSQLKAYKQAVQLLEVGIIAHF